jgi:2-polyprenyl-6-methoxyphenol hydroxylase-like FAD-dependent oxidoreductase
MKKGNHAIVIGGSIAGLLAARVLSEHFERVSVIERDSLQPDLPLVRKGVPQARHVHGVWARGLAIIDRLLPGLARELVDGGAISGDVARDFVWYQFGHTKLRQAVGVPATVMTRPFLEWHVRKRVLALPNVEHINLSVTGFATDAEHARITGVVVKRADGSKTPLLGDLVVDASGRSGIAARWLEGLGYGSPPESKVRIDVTYATCMFRRTRATDALGYLIGSTPPLGRRAGFCFAVEDGRWQMTLVGLMGEEPPTDLPGFRDYAGSLPLPQLHEIACGEEPVGEIASYRFPFNRRRHYERLAMFPEGLLVLGDALASFNPAYGQGITVAAIEIELLEGILAAAPELKGVAKNFFAAAAEVIDVPWSQAIAEDLRYPEAQGSRPLLLPAINAYVGRLHRAASLDARVCRAFFEVAGLQKRPAHLFSPEIMWRCMFPASAERAAIDRLADSPIDVVAGIAE